MKNKKIIFNIGGIALIFGSLSALISDVLAILIVEDHNLVRQTVSQLAHGKYAYIQDIGLTIFGLGTLVGGLAMYAMKSNSALLKWGATLLGIMGVCIAILAEFNQFAGTPGTTIHIMLAVVIGLLFLICSIIIGVVLKKINNYWHYSSIGIGISFLTACSGFLIIPEVYEGIYERGVIFLVIIWFCAMGSQMIINKERTN